ncbi:MAG: LL-diaminopimelate aminotransferase [Clostridia bacterium]|nr:LL-diaminopimelate aminotransferase [Clostridia bacterium]
MKLNTNYSLLKESYLFAEVANRAKKFAEANPIVEVIKLGIGDVTLPICAAAVEAGKAASQEMGKAETFRGYGPYEGYDFLREKIAAYYARRGVNLSVNEIFVSEGAKSDVTGILDLFAVDNTVLVPDPVYPVYVDSNIMDGRKIVYIDGNEENGFLPLPNKKIKADIIYLCSPNNPTGAAYDKAGLKAWVDYANSLGAVILFDAAYEFFISDDKLPHSIYEIDGAKNCAVEICSFSKTAGFTGVRLGYMTIPRELAGGKLNSMWLRRQSTKYNGASYVVQRMGEAVFSEEGMKQIKAGVAAYMKNAALMSETLKRLGIWHTGGVNSPYIWLKCPDGDSWAFFDRLLSGAGVVGTPGAGFGKMGEGYFRLTAFNTFENTSKAMSRLEQLLRQ